MRDLDTQVSTRLSTEKTTVPLDVLAKTGRQCTMFDGVAERDSAIVMGSTSSNVTAGHAYKAVPDHERDCGPLLLRERQEARASHRR